MRKMLLTVVSLMCFGTSMAQIQITPYIDEQNCLSMPNGICEILKQKLTNIISQNGIQSQMGQSRFVLTCNVTEESKNVLATSPTQIAYVLDIHLFIGDGETGTKYISQSFRSKGVGSTEEKAYRNAVKNMQTKSQQMTEFVGKGTARIIDYYAFYQLDGESFERDVFRVKLDFAHNFADYIIKDVYWCCELVRSAVGISGEFDRVMDQIHPHVREDLFVGFDPHLGQLGDDLNIFAGPFALVEQNTLTELLVQIKFCAVGNDLLVFQLG